jgi:hypothetical protein
MKSLAVRKTCARLEIAIVDSVLLVSQWGNGAERMYLGAALFFYLEPLESDSGS